MMLLSASILYASSPRTVFYLSHGAPITPMKTSAKKSFVVIAPNHEMIVRCLSSSDVFRNVTARTENIMRQCLLTRTHKRRELNSVSSAKILQPNNK